MTAALKRLAQAGLVERAGRSRTGWTVNQLEMRAALLPALGDLPRRRRPVTGPAGRAPGTYHTNHEHRETRCPHPFADRYREAMRQAGGACPIESGVLGRLADNECDHGRLPGDRTGKCGCWPQENAPVIALSQRAPATAARQTEGRLTRDGERRSHAPLSNRRLHRAGAA